MEADRVMSRLPKIILAAAVAFAATAPNAAAGDPLPMSEARGQIRTATEMWAGLLDGRAHVKRCVRTTPSAVRCEVVISGAGTRCEMRVSVVRRSKFDSVRARGLRCASA